MAFDCVRRPDWSIRHWFTRPPAGWHRIEDSGRWHLYDTHAIQLLDAVRVRATRACDRAVSDLDRPPLLIHGDDLELGQGESVCAVCWRAWEGILALPG